MKISKLIFSARKMVVDSTFRFNVFSRLGFYDSLSDEKYINKKFQAYMHEPLDIACPGTFNEKIQWLKLFNRKREHCIMADKYRVRDYISEKIGPSHLIPLIGVWDDPNDIEFDNLPNRFVLKCNHNSGKGMYICKDKRLLKESDYLEIKKKLRQGLKQDYYKIGREWSYKDIPRKIVCEEYLEDKQTNELRDYKFFCFNGEVKCFKIDFDRFTEHRANYYDRLGHLLDCGEEICPPDHLRHLEMPSNLNLMIELAEKLSQEEYFLRVDFYEVDGTVYFGELTFYPASGFGKFTDAEWDNRLGSWINLPHEMK